MTNRNNQSPVSDEDRKAIWNAWLNGDTLAAIKRYDVEHLSTRAIRRVLEEGPPASLAADPRVAGRHYFWMAVHGVKNPETGEEDAFIVFRRPRKLTQRTLSKAVSHVRRELRALHPKAELMVGVMEGFDTDAADLAERKIKEDGYLGWSFDEEGNVERIDPATLSPKPREGERPKADPEGFKRFLATTGTLPPREGDEIPEGWLEEDVSGHEDAPQASSHQVTLKNGREATITVKRVGEIKLQVSAIDASGAPMGFVTFYRNRGRDTWTASSAFVNDGCRRIGVATAMYDAAEGLGIELEPEGNPGRWNKISPDARAFWESRRRSSGPKP